ncbi:hypothetical protein [Pseudaestuariivita rosea]|uniref:hypothetical protein n=1 Tax=Pseudaestuariivita rosea TaxID=2763263 RepID=UPI001ABA877E|nr:hypothetical protein [Pseudaestuariivita rosea]
MEYGVHDFGEEPEQEPRFACAGLEVELLHWWQKLAATLKEHLGDSISNDQAFAAAMLMYSPYGTTGPRWPNINKGYGIGRGKFAHEMLNEVRSVLEEILADEEAGSRAKDEVRDQVRSRLFEHARPIWPQIKGMRYKGDQALLDMLSLACHYLEADIDKQKLESGNFRAIRIALSLRVVFESYTYLPVTAGDDFKQNPTSVFGFCLKGIYETCEINAGFRHYGEKAKDANPNHVSLVEIRKILSEYNGIVRSNPEIQSFTVTL